jgi:hypothetical protein
MFAQRALRAPLQMSARGMRPMAFRAAAIAPFHTKPAPVQQQKQQQTVVRSKWFAPPPAPGKHMVGRFFERTQGSIWCEMVALTSSCQIPAKAAMPQLVPFYFVNEVVFAFTIIPLLIYVFSKYILPAQVRRYAARLFTSKL